MFILKISFQKIIKEITNNVKTILNNLKFQRSILKALQETIEVFFYRIFKNKISSFTFYDWF